MRIIKPCVELEPINGIKIMKNIEKACRICYRSEGNITEDSYIQLLTNCINRGHMSPLEHEKVTVSITCDIGVYKDLTRHRICSFAVESTRYCNYSKDKYGNEINFIEPLYYDDDTSDKTFLDIKTNKELPLSKKNIWECAMRDIQEYYMKMTQELKCPPDEARMLLPHSTAAKIVVTSNIREWKHIFELRCSKFAHPSVQQVMIPLLLYFKEQMPLIFGDVEYNTDFPKEKYAEIKFIEE